MEGVGGGGARACAGRTGRIPRFRRPLVAVLAVAVGWAANAPAEPLDLSDPNPRWIQIAFEVSPRDEPGRLRSHYTQPLPAWLEPDERPDRVSIRVSGSVIEKHVVAADDPVPGSFSDFVWELDRSTFEVLSARVEGTLVKPVDLGLVTTRAPTRIRVEMSSERRAGYRGSQRHFGHRLFRYCDATDGDGCNWVEAAPYDPESGYVNAVGTLTVHAGPIRIRTFSPLGEALLSEWPEAPAALAASQSGTGAELEGEGHP